MTKVTYPVSTDGSQSQISSMLLAAINGTIIKRKATAAKTPPIKGAAILTQKKPPFGPGRAILPQPARYAIIRGPKSRAGLMPQKKPTKTFQKIHRNKLPSISSYHYFIFRIESSVVKQAGRFPLHDRKICRSVTPERIGC